MAKFIVLFFVAVAILHVNAQEAEEEEEEEAIRLKCPENSHYSYCASAKQATCADQYIITYMTMNCVERCDCDAEYVLNRDGKCVQPLDCNPEEIRCYEGQSYSTSGNQLVCNEVTDLSVLKPGCYCPKGLFFDTVVDKCVEEVNCTGPFVWDIMGGEHPIDLEYDYVEILVPIDAATVEEQPIKDKTDTTENQPIEVSEQEQPIVEGTEQPKESEQSTDVATDEHKVVEEPKEVEEIKVDGEPKVVEEPKEVEEIKVDGEPKVVEEPKEVEEIKVDGEPKVENP